PTSKCLRYSSRKYFTDEWIGLVAPSPSAQNERPRMLSAMSVIVDRSSSVPWPASRRLSTCLSPKVPSQQGVHLPHDPCAYNSVQLSNVRTPQVVSSEICRAPDP